MRAVTIGGFGRGGRGRGVGRGVVGAVGWIAVAMLGLAGCGGDDDAGGQPTPTRTAVATATPASTATSTLVPHTPTATSAPPTHTALPPSPTPTSTAEPTATATADPTATATALPNPLIEGPVTGGRGSPLVQATLFDLNSVGYQQTEFFVSGTAAAYTAAGTLGTDGVWPAIPAGTTAAYKTRIVVYRPIDAQAFNGSVVVEWLNVSGGLDAAPDWTSAHTELIREGYAWVGVSAQRVGIEGGGGPFNLSLKTVDPTRYGSLVHPTDSFSYDMFTQVGRALRAPAGLDPLGGLRPARLIAAGESQSAFRLVTYVNAIHPLVRVYDGFLVHSRGGGGAPLAQAPLEPVAMPTPARIRTDLAEPVLTFQTETDLFVLDFLPARQPDSERFRLWEVAGTAHADTYTLGVGFSDLGTTPIGAELWITAVPIPGFISCERPINSGPQHMVLKAAVHALDRWIRGDAVPPSAPLLDVGGDPPHFLLDPLGNVTGGIRTSWVDVPLATLSGEGQTGGAFCGLFGTTVPFDQAMLQTLYGTHANYIAAVAASAEASVAAGFIRPADAALINQAAVELEFD